MIAWGVRGYMRVKFQHFPLTLLVVLTTLSHYRVSVWLNDVQWNLCSAEIFKTTLCCRLDADCDSKVISRCVHIEHVAMRHCLKTVFTRSWNLRRVLFWICTAFCSKGLNIDPTSRASSNVFSVRSIYYCLRAQRSTEILTVTVNTVVTIVWKHTAQ